MIEPRGARALRLMRYVVGLFHVYSSTSCATWTEILELPRGGVCDGDWGIPFLVQTRVCSTHSLQKVRKKEVGQPDLAERTTAWL